MNISQYQNLDYQNYHRDKITHCRRFSLYYLFYAPSRWIFPCVPLHWHSEAELIVIQKGQGYSVRQISRNSSSLQGISFLSAPAGST